MKVQIIHGDMLEVLPTLAAESVDAVVTDPPYHLTSIVKRFGSANAAPAKSNGATGVYGRASAGFMGKTWDGGDIAARVETWAELFRVLKPGAHLVAFGGTRTYHRMACAIEDAGFEIRDSIGDLIASDTHVQAFLGSLTDEQRRAFMRCVDESSFGGMLQWIYGSGFPKSHDIGKAIDRAAGAEREVVGPRARIDGKAPGHSGLGVNGIYGTGADLATLVVTAPATDAARQWDGWGTALKPAWEPIVLARKPLAERTVAAQVLATGTGAIHVDACRIESGSDYHELQVTQGADSGNTYNGWSDRGGLRREASTFKPAAGRWPANLLHDGSPEVLETFARFGEKTSGKAGINGHRRNDSLGDTSSGWGMRQDQDAGHLYGDTGTAARFFYTAKANASDRLGSKHPTVKPISLMRWLVRLITPPGGIVLDPFAGTGTTGQAALIEGCNAILIEREAEHVADIHRRLGHVRGDTPLLSFWTAVLADLARIARLSGNGA